ncbi:hypothetical protein DKG77_01955 [Flagellimonas aquimarina]|uniref:Uncharacterized protein n=1 Tax=Flagellimonas aquimarina TaxID=2201895 RepID=A0A316LHS3_9FLAO|nr:hypothetical protein [Allomuricauda koreensis]PWL39620.1 hypothetical protein DKG77_01955 [Allomuricauda koreensis]
MKEMPVNQLSSIEEINAEIQKAQSQIPNLRKQIPVAIPLIIMFSSVLPFLHGRYGARPMMESIGYWKGVFFCKSILLAAWVYSYYRDKTRLENRVADLKFRRGILQKRSNG